MILKIRTREWESKEPTGLITETRLQRGAENVCVFGDRKLRSLVGPQQATASTNSDQFLLQVT